MLLYINATDLNQVHLALLSQDFFAQTKLIIPYPESHTLLELLQNFLKIHKTPLTKISRIIIASGPGSFTGTRVSIALALGLGTSLTIPVNAIPNAKIPENLTDLFTYKPQKTLTILYSRPAI